MENKEIKIEEPFAKGIYFIKLFTGNKLMGIEKIVIEE
jgi:hypothetical protein